MGGQDSNGPAPACLSADRRFGWLPKKYKGFHISACPLGSFHFCHRSSPRLLSAVIWTEWLFRNSAPPSAPPLFQNRRASLLALRPSIPAQQAAPPSVLAPPCASPARQQKMRRGTSVNPCRLLGEVREQGDGSLNTGRPSAALGVRPIRRVTS